MSRARKSRSLLLGEIGRQLSTAPPAEAELTPRKAVLIGRLFAESRDGGWVVSRLAHWRCMALGLDEINRYINSVQAISPQTCRSLRARGWMQRPVTSS